MITNKNNPIKLILSFLFLESLIFILMWNDLYALYIFSTSKGLYSYMIFIPFISFYLIYLKRKKIFSAISPSLIPGIICVAMGMILFFIGKEICPYINENDYLSITIAGWLLVSIGLFIICFGYSTFKNALFPLLFLFFLVPIPSFLLNNYIELLRKGSEEISFIIFKLLGIPILRIGNIFQLPNFTIEVARECSGIRSSIGLWITAILSSYIFLKRYDNRFFLLLSVIPIAIVKNGLRIVTLGLLASYVDPIYITNHWLHRSGGILYFIIALLVLFFPLLFFLKLRDKN